MTYLESLLQDNREAMTRVIYNSKEERLLHPNWYYLSIHHNTQKMICKAKFYYK